LDILKTTSLTFRIDSDLKNQTEQTLADIGLTMSGAFTVFAKAIVRTGKIPFELAADPFYREEHQSELRRRAERIRNGTAEMVSMTMEELEGKVANG
jgi:DNA-damage-inducible protein J